jgi:hypothetical protein
MTEIATPQDYSDNELIKTANMIVYSYRVFGNTYSTFEEHNVHLAPLESTPSIPVSHTVDIKLTIPLAEDEDGKFSRKGDRNLSIAVLGEAGEPSERLPSMDGIHTRLTQTDLATGLETPILAVSHLVYTLHRPKSVHSRVALYGVEAGIDEIEHNDASFFTGIMANLLGSRSLSIRRLGAITTELALENGRSAVREIGILNVATFAEALEKQGISTDALYRLAAARKLPSFFYESSARMIRSSDEPTITESTLRCSAFQNGVQTNTTFLETDFKGFSPADPTSHAVFTQLVDEDSLEVGNSSRAFDGEFRTSRYPDADNVLSAVDSRSLGRALRIMRRASKAYIDTASQLIDEKAS